MTTITKEQLIKLLQHRISVAAKYPDIEEAQIDATVFKIALASVEATPIYQVDYGNAWRDVERVQYDDHAVHGLPVRIIYSAPPSHVVPDEWTLQDAINFVEEIGALNESDAAYHAWNVCRAAMLQAEPVSQTYKLPAAPQQEAKA